MIKEKNDKKDQWLEIIKELEEMKAELEQLFLEREETDGQEH